jgi:opacity protein-like surface antigen
VLLCINTKTKAQGKFGVFIGAGTMFYEGDLKERPWPHPLTMRWTANAGLHWQITRRWGLQLNYTVGEIIGDDKYAASASKRARDFRFQSYLHEIGLRGTFDILPNDKWKFLPYLTAGVSALNFEPKRDGVALRPLATEGVAYSNWHVSFPTGLGIKYQVSCQWALKAEAIYHWTLTDYLDDVSGAYPDAEVPFYSDPGDVSPPREMRGDPKWKDGFWDINVGVIFFFSGCGSGKKGGMIEDCDQLYKGVDMDELLKKHGQ